jgi:flagellar hook-length control protein FliK
LEARPLAPPGPASLQTASGGLSRIAALSPLAALRRPEAGIGSRGGLPETPPTASADGFAKVLRQAVSRGEPEADPSAPAPASGPDRSAEELPVDAVAAGDAAQPLPVEDPPARGRRLSASAPPGADPESVGVQRPGQDPQEASAAGLEARTAGPGASAAAPGPDPRGPGLQDRAAGPELPGARDAAAPPGSAASPPEMRPEARAAAQPAGVAGTPAPVAGGSGTLPEPAALGGSAMATATSSPAAGSAPAAAGTAAEMRLATPPGQPGFAATLGSTVTLMLRDGLQAARLHLHPAELGPISVRITLEGTAARVHLAAEHPLTRQAMEQALPVLAGSLRESGLTLAGGGVSDQPRQGGAASGQAASDARRDSDGAGGDDPARGSLIESRPGSAPAVIAGRRGLVDLVA